MSTTRPPEGCPSFRADLWSVVQGIGTFVIDVVLPCHCLSCGRVERGSMRLGLCTGCRGDLEPVLGLAAGLGTGLATSALDRIFFGWSYRAPLDRVIHALKFGGLPYLGKHLGQALAATLPDLELDAVVPVPLHWRRRWQRGYNQSLEIATALAAQRSWPVEQLLIRRRATAAQTGLDRSERRRNLNKAFIARSPRGGRRPGRILVVDDVYTTGATLEAAAGALRQTGASWVGAVVAGRTPSPLP